MPIIPKAMLQKALWYVNNQEKRVRKERDEEGEFTYYIMSKSSNIKFTSITNHLLRMYQKACRGEQDKSIKTLDYLFDVCSSLHPVTQPVQGYKVRLSVRVCACACKYVATVRACWYVS